MPGENSVLAKFSERVLELESEVVAQIITVRAGAVTPPADKKSKTETRDLSEKRKQR